MQLKSTLLSTCLYLQQGFWLRFCFCLISSIIFDMIATFGFRYILYKQKGIENHINLPASTHMGIIRLEMPGMSRELSLLTMQPVQFACELWPGLMSRI